MELHVLQCITHPRSRQHMNNVKNYATTRLNMQINYSVTWREIISINGGKKREHSSGILIICHKNALSSLSLSLTHSLSDPLFPSDSGLRQAMDILRLAGIKRLSVKNCKKRKEPLRVLKTDMGSHLTHSPGQSWQNSRTPWYYVLHKTKRQKD